MEYSYTPAESISMLPIIGWKSVPSLLLRIQLFRYPRLANLSISEFTIKPTTPLPGITGTYYDIFGRLQSEFRRFTVVTSHAATLLFHYYHGDAKLTAWCGNNMFRRAFQYRHQRVPHWRAQLHQQWVSSCSIVCQSSTRKRLWVLLPRARWLPTEWNWLCHLWRCAQANVANKVISTYSHIYLPSHL